MRLVKLFRNIRLGLGSLWAHRLRSLLTALGIVFGVASVICMLAIGEGLSYEAREQIKRLGSNNIILRSVKPQEEPEDGQRSREIQYGLTYVDIERIAETVPGIDVIVPHRDIRQTISFGSRKVDGMVIGTLPYYLRSVSGRIVAGRFIGQLDVENTANVCVLDVDTTRDLVGVYELIGGTVLLGPNAYRVIGVLEGGAVAGREAQETALESVKSVYIPLTSARRRFGDTIVNRSSGSFSAERIELHGAIVRAEYSDDVLAIRDVIKALLDSAHEQADYEMIVPLQLLREKERVKRLYNIVLGLMAAISLVVGGIGIMNIMLATVTERTPEIGTRRAIGARKRDIMAQFLTETVLLSGAGGLSGVVLGLAMSWAVFRFAAVKTIVTPWAVGIAFSISALIGIVFGFYPAARAAGMDPISALRHE